MRTQQHNEPLSYEKVLHMFRETDKQMKETDKKMKELQHLFTGHWGKLIESLIEGDLINMLAKRGINIRNTYTRATYTYNHQKGEIDIIAANGNEVVVVEVKTTLHPKDVEEFIETLTIFKKAFPIYKNETIYGAVAYLKTESKADLRAERMGLFVIRATGNSATITNDKKFKPTAF